jgi:hypothetical protein
VFSFYLVTYFNGIQQKKTQGILLLVAYNNTCYNKNVLVQLYMISDMAIVWKIALENDFIKSKHVVLKLKFFISGGDGKILNVSKLTLKILTRFIFNGMF